MLDRIAAAAEARTGWPSRRGGTKAISARARLARQLWTADGERRLPSVKELDAALSGLKRGDLEWICELSALGPLYLLPTREWLRALVRQLRQLGARTILEVAAGDGFLTRALAAAAPDLSFLATDSGAWEDPKARMTKAEEREHRDVIVPGIQSGEEVLKLEATEAIRALQPDLVLAAWLPPGPLLDRLIRADVPHVLELGAAGGVTAGAWSWRHAHEFLEGPLESLLRCRLDERPARSLHSRVTLYFGAAHPEHAVEKVRPGDWLWQFKPGW